jgi:hypothetical protein
MAAYTQNQAADVFRQFSDGDPQYTIYYPDGTPADALNDPRAYGRSDTGLPPIAPADLLDQLQRWRLMQNPLNPDHTLAPAVPAPPSWLDEIEQDIRAMIPTLPTLPWGWIGVGALAFVVAPAFLGAVMAPPPRRRRRR